ncbi:AraC family transcriptional regulator [Algisphaera agarilytica]|uniref:AraC-like DNA-binding protein n=1 Tax=Algisphaera agarilytica TaxID=1385975 RepID=A0A7X0H6B2_9BACT|nr:helix-turn-helix domain-containing protein [Algisphaera agarilytica]MBB6430103.1 AraC-like DNA-binding protein [Algisphaera agarilytica]
MDIPLITYRPREPREQNLEVIDLQQINRDRHRMSHDPTQPHRLDFHLLVYVEAGRGEHFIDFARHPFGPGSFIFVSRSQVNAFDFTDEPRGRAVVFTDGFADETQVNTRASLFSPMQIASNPGPVFQPDDDLLERACSVLAELEHEATRQAPDSMIVILLFAALLRILDRGRPVEGRSDISRDQREDLSRFIELLHDHHASTRDASYYADQLSMTYKTLNALCKRAAGQTAKQMIDSYVVLEVKRRLALEKPSIQALAYELGFEDASNFSKYFKRCAGLTPAEFMKNSAG